MNENKKQEQKKDSNKNIVYMLIGMLTLVLAVTGATFAYYTSSDTAEDAFTGNMATITFNVSVAKKSNVDNTRGLIPMTNSMVEKAVSEDYGDGICLDDNNNAVCQIYKVTINNSSTASMFFDGYVTLTGGSGTATDDATSPTTMRWAQAFCEEDTDGALTSCTTAGGSTVHQSNSITWDALGSNASGLHNTAEIIKTYDTTNLVGDATIQGNTYKAIKTNYIRISIHTAGATYKQSTDVTSALVFNQYLSPKDANTGNDTGDSADTYTDAQVYYIAIWLSETGKNQTSSSTNVGTPAGSGINFFQGVVTFTSAQGSEVTAMFGDYTSVSPDTVQ